MPNLEALRSPIEIEVIYDFICPWCWIGHSHLKTALEQAAMDAQAHIRFVPYELNPDMPRPGVDRKNYRTVKFGSWARSQAMDADVTAAGQRAGLEFRYDRIATTPNTRFAHRLMWWAQRAGDPARSASLFDAIFAAYFQRGEHIGRPEVLAAVAAGCGFDHAQILALLAGEDGDQEVAAIEQASQREGIHAVPTVRIEQLSFSGAQPAASILTMLERATSKHAPKVA